MPDWLSRTGVAVTRERIAAGEAVRRAPVRGMESEIVEAIADDELRVGRGREQGRDRRRRMLAVGVDDEHRLGGGVPEELGEAGANRASLATVGGQPQELHAGLAREQLELRALSAGEPSSTMRRRPAWRRVSARARRRDVAVGRHQRGDGLPGRAAPRATERAFGAKLDLPEECVDRQARFRPRGRCRRAMSSGKWAPNRTRVKATART